MNNNVLIELLKELYFSRNWIEQEFLYILPNNNVQHLVGQGSYHASLLVQCSLEEKVVIKSFKFLNFWVNHPQFQNIVKEAWGDTLCGRLFYRNSYQDEKDQESHSNGHKDKFSHSYIKGRMKKLYTSEVQIIQWNVVNSNEQIDATTVTFPKDQFKNIDVLNNQEC
ncbi:hypothetical protein H5410_059947 [Solanum commersonii]|uniref:Uncharacterized protein n=1 Tax=Solanum commersonii TaxID=4109 RepID=A0A9J5W3T2_SOLCO|nr:hypothetical protein H5410_059947 [Solanum commersonii]